MRDRIVNIASTAGLRGLPERVAYCASKHALVGFTRALALDLRASKVTVNAVCPGAVVTSLSTYARPDADRSGWLQPEEVAETVLFLVGPLGGAVNGAVLEMNDRSS